MILIKLTDRGYTSYFESIEQIKQMYNINENLDSLEYIEEYLFKKFKRRFNFEIVNRYEIQFVKLDNTYVKLYFDDILEAKAIYSELIIFSRKYWENPDDANFENHIIKEIWLKKYDERGYYEVIQYNQQDEKIIKIVNELANKYNYKTISEHDFENNLRHNGYIERFQKLEYEEEHECFIVECLDGFKFVILISK